jgi:hypothetical protein
MIAALLAANVGDLVEVVVVLIIILFSALARWLGNVQKPPLKRPAWQPPPAKEPDKDIQSQIEEFLERSAQRQAGGQPAAAQPAPPAQPLAAEIVPEPSVGGRIGRSVQEDLDTSEFRRRSTQLGQEVTQADDAFDERVRQTFSGEVSQLSKQPGEAAQATPTAAEPTEAERTDEDEAAVPLVNLWSNPGSIVNAIILSEVLRTPEWDE